MRNENPTVYSTSSGRICPKCGKPVSACVCKKANNPVKGDGVVRIFRDTKHRKGKTITLITGVPLTGQTLHALHSDLKRMCGSGGSIKDGNLEIQGDHRNTVLAELKKRGFTAKLAGG
ncbi:MAG: translation initiation factor Sui1 [Leptolinea sp.]|nr:translation initiation factor Sui1 [Leptolinea sp.]